jgi:hypothetical protein
MESSQADPTTELLLVTNGQGLDMEPFSSLQTASLISSNWRKKQALFQNERNQIAVKRFQQMMEKLKKN